MVDEAGRSRDILRLRWHTKEPGPLQSHERGHHISMTRAGPKESHTEVADTRKGAERGHKNSWKTALLTLVMEDAEKGSG